MRLVVILNKVLCIYVCSRASKTSQTEQGVLRQTQPATLSGLREEVEAFPREDYVG